MNFEILDKKEFIQTFLNPIVAVSPICTIGFNSLDSKTTCICSSTDNTMTLVASTFCKNDEDKTIDLPDLKRLMSAFNCVANTEAKFKVVGNKLSYNDGSFRFSYHLLEPGIVKKVPINPDKINKLQYDTTFTVTKASIDILMKGVSFAAETTKLYIFIENEKVFAELGDRTKHNVDNFVYPIADEYTGSSIMSPVPIKLDTFRLVYTNFADLIKFSINHQHGIIKIDIGKNTTLLTYVFSALIT